MWSSRYWLLASCLALGACGFQLRGDPQVGFRTLYISSVGGSAVVGDMKRALATGPTRLVATAPEAEAHLRVLQEEREKTVSTITGSGRVYEYQLTLRVRYDLVLNGREDALIPPTSLETRRLISYTETAPTAKEAEEQLLYKDMQLDLGRQILRQVAAAARNAAS
jgi:LPS-assembly lipoprotein